MGLANSTQFLANKAILVRTLLFGLCCSWNIQKTVHALKELMVPENKFRLCLRHEMLQI
jgi:hypothetical protein